MTAFLFIERRTPSAHARRRAGETIHANGETSAPTAVSCSRSVFERLVVASRPRLFAYALIRVGDPDRAEDLVQETLLRAWEMREQYISRDRGSWMSWCKRIADNLLIDRWRHERVLQMLYADDLIAQDASGRGDGHATSSYASLPSLSPSPEDEALIRERLAAAEDAMRRLPERQRRALMLRAEGHSLGEIGAAIGAPTTTVKAYIWRARASVRASMAAKGLDSGPSR